MRRAMVLLLLAGCPTYGDRAFTGKCPAGETCSVETPDGLQFIGTPISGQVLASGPAITAVHGTQPVELELGDGGVFDLPYFAFGGNAVSATDTSANVVTLSGLASGTNKLRITDDSNNLYDSITVSAAPIASVQVVSPTFGNIVTAEVAFATGTQDVAIALLDSEQERLVDTSMMVSTTGGATRTAWDTLHWDDAQPGVTEVDITAGGAAQASFALEFVAGADHLALASQPTILAGTSADVCFVALTADDRQILGLPEWDFTTDDGTITTSPLGDGCATLSPATAGTAHVHASAGGQSLDADITVTANTTHVRGRPDRPRPVLYRSPDGDRASL